MEAELKQFMQDYCGAFKPDDCSRVLEFYNVPLAMVFADQLVVLNTKEEVAGTITAMLNALVEKNFKESKLDTIGVTALTEKTVLVSAAFTRYRRDGSVLERLGATYTVVRGAAGFKIVALVAHGVEGVRA
jgi:hypothetical protein